MISEDILSSDTACKLIHAGIQQFGQYGQKATTRNVVEHAGANIAAIPYYFRNKNGLYNACMHFIVDEIWNQLGDKTIELQGRLEHLSKAEAQEALLGIMDAFCQFFLRDVSVISWSQFIMREHATPSEAYEIFYERYYKHMQAIKCSLLAKCLSKAADDDDIKINTHAIFGQVLAFLIGRESLVRGLGVKELSEAHIEKVRLTIRHNVKTIINCTI